jgi:hypothetical protein
MMMMMMMYLDTKNMFFVYKLSINFNGINKVSTWHRQTSNITMTILIHVVRMAALYSTMAKVVCTNVYDYKLKQYVSSFLAVFRVVKQDVILS